MHVSLDNEQSDKCLDNEYRFLVVILSIMELYTVVLLYDYFWSAQKGRESKSSGGKKIHDLLSVAEEEVEVSLK